MRRPAPSTFSLDAAGRGATVVILDLSPARSIARTGEPVHHVFHDYVRTEVMIPMRDGVKLHAVILKPADIATPLPILIERTPYGVDGRPRASFFARVPSWPAMVTSTSARIFAAATRARANSS